ncbi:MAG: ATP-binding protein [Balneolaceae bacterium]|nr:ATP-binding protein [Balneolaceae bacterium]MBO6547904.1 ATP-binding protein [Balneolaceae bacterium]MBO6648417.1 ATP-binding protein [Balneolaceae bacterium]
MNIQKELVLKSEYEEVEKVEHLLNELQDEIGFNDEFYAKLMLTVSEAATNGIVHGNQLDASKKVVLTAESDGKKLIFTSKDEGPGFEPEEVPDPLAEENLLKPSGRGVFLMKEYADEVEYQENGTKLVLRFKLP